MTSLTRSLKPRRDVRMASASIVLVGLLFLVTATEGLICYQCGTSGIGGPTSQCIYDIPGMINTSLGLSNTYYKNCTKDNPRWDRCLIETSEKAGKIEVYHRGCHDGVKLGDGSASYARFKNLPPNNYSTCDAIGDSIICYRFCDSDFCNGPRPPIHIPTECELYEADPYNYELPVNVTCGADGIRSGPGPIPFHLLVVGLASLLLVSSLTLN